MEGKGREDKEGKLDRERIRAAMQFLFFFFSFLFLILAGSGLSRGVWDLVP